MKKINVIGTSASGKSTFSKILAENLGLEYIELDDLFWKDNWQESTDVELIQKMNHSVHKANHDLCKNGYVIDGCYTRFRASVWREIDTVIWINLPFHVNLYQSLKRTFSRLITQEKIWLNSNNTESLKMIFSRDSIIVWMLQTYFKNQKKYVSWMSDPQYSHIQFICLRSRKQVKQFLVEIEHD